MAALLYGDAMRDAIMKGDLRSMKALAVTAEKQLKASGNLPAALEILKSEIAKAEYAAKGSSKK